ncbi:NAD(P)-dependent oxidoreductase [Synechococcus sp. UW140]|uniref:NAD(P)-dependent oxidoreductase n=1 Tax=Synechococcus sp. UW140 TaxID=368503 RepID=UPI003137F891
MTITQRLRIYVQPPVRLKPKALDLCIKRFHFCGPPLAEIAFIGVHEIIDDKYLSNFPNLRYLLCPATGLNHIQQGLLSTRGIKLYSLRDCMDEIKTTTSTTELTFMLILLLMRQGHRLQSSLRNKLEFNRLDYEGHELSKYSVGIIGFGRIGSGVYRIIKALGASVKVWDIDTQKLQSIPSEDQAKSMRSLLNNSQIISLHVNLSKDTFGLINSHAFSEMQESVFLINTARAELVDQESLYHALLSDKLQGYASDVHWNEEGSIKFDERLVELREGGKNIYLTPHIGGCTHEATEHTQHIILSHFLRQAYPNQIS